MLTPTNAAERHRLFWGLQCAGWGGTLLLGLAFVSTGYLPWRDALIIGLFRTGFGFGATCLLRLGYRWLRLHPGNVWAWGGGIFVFCGVLAGIDCLLTTSVVGQAGVDLSHPKVAQFLDGSLILRWLLYWLWSVLYFGITHALDMQRTRVRLAEAEAAARTSELQALRAQINPHFLFNALGSILADSENAATVRHLTLALADYLRFSFQVRGDYEPLGTELHALENYLRVEKARFEENLEYRIDVPTVLRQSPVPPALVLPLLENAIKYGQRSSIRPLRLAISAQLANGELHVAVTNSGEWIEETDGASIRTGLANLRRRLELLYGKRARLITKHGNGEVCVSVFLPLAEGNGKGQTALDHSREAVTS
jgi:hypothetical protein